MEESDIHRLEGSSADEPGGLIIRKKPSEHQFKKPQGYSMYGLDKLAAEVKRKKEEEAKKERERNYRHREDETPTHTGGVNREAQKRMEERLKRQRLDEHRSKDRDRDRDRDRSERRDRSDRRDRDRERSRGRDSSYRHTPKFRDEPHTPRFRSRVSISLHNYFLEF